MSSTENPVSNPQSFKSLGQVAKQIGISRTYLSERLHTEVPGHYRWPSLNRVGGAYIPGAFLIAARVAKLTPRPAYDVVNDPSASEAYALIDSVAYAISAVVGVEGDHYHHPRLERVELVALLRSMGDILTAALDGLPRPVGYGDEDLAAESEAAP